MSTAIDVVAADLEDALANLLNGRRSSRGRRTARRRSTCTAAARAGGRSSTAAGAAGGGAVSSSVRFGGFGVAAVMLASNVCRPA